MKLNGITTQRRAIDFMTSYFLKKGFDISRHNIPFHGHAILSCGKFKVYCLYKKDYYRDFGKKYKIFVKNRDTLSGIGDSISNTAMDIALKRRCDLILFLHPNEVKCINPITMYKICNAHKLHGNQDAGSLRQVSKGIRVPVQEYTYSIAREILDDFKLIDLVPEEKNQKLGETEC